MKIKQFKNIPEKSQVLKEIDGKVDYVDCFCIEHQHLKQHSIDYMTSLLFISKPPRWMQLLMSIRAIVAKVFGLKTAAKGGSKEVDDSICFSPGDKVGFFPVIGKSENEIVLAESDKHLSFRASVLIGPHPKKITDVLYVTTIVQFRNIWGKIYFVPVKPFHKLIVKNKLNALIKYLTSLPAAIRTR